MAGLGDIVQKAFYLGIGLASYAGEKAGTTLAQLRTQAQKLAEEMVARGEMTTEEARKFVEEILARAQQQQAQSSKQEPTAEPRRIEILDDEEPSPSESANVDSLRAQVRALEEELKRLQQQ